MRAIILAGGAGTRLRPATLAVNKHLLPVYSKPLIHHAVCTAMRTGARDLLVVTNPGDEPAFARLLADGSRWGVSIRYAAQDRPRGVADAFLVDPSFSEPGCALVLGDNIVHAPIPAPDNLRGAHCFALPVDDPRRFGVIELDADGRPESIEEKPAKPRSNLAVPGLYLFDSDINAIAAGLTPSPRGELEITDALRVYVRTDALTVTRWPDSCTWIDAGTPEALHRAQSFIRDREVRTGTLVGSPELTARELGLINDEQLERLAADLDPSPYAEALRRALP